MISLDNIEGLKTVVEVARGGFHDVAVYPKNILAAVPAAQTDRFYIAHNHPTGSVRPTKQDMQLTADVMEAANAVGMSFEDHIITGPEGWFSFFDHGLLIRATGLGFQDSLKPPRRKAAGRTGRQKG